MALRDDVAKLLDGPQPSQRYYLAVLGAVDWLDHKPELRGPEIADELLVRELSNPDRTPEAKALALSAGKTGQQVSYDRAPERISCSRNTSRCDWRPFDRSPNKRIPSGSIFWRRWRRTIRNPTTLRAEAIVGLSAAAEQNRGLLEKLAASEHADASS